MPEVVAFDEGERFLIRGSPVNASESSEGVLGYRAGSHDVTLSLRKGFCFPLK